MTVPHRLDISPLESPQDYLSNEVGTKMFTQTDELHEAREQINLRMGIQLGDDPTEIYNKYFYESQLLSGEKNGRPFLRLVHNGQGIADMTPEFAKEYFEKVVFKRDLKKLKEEIHAKINVGVDNGKEFSELVVSETPEQLTNLRHEVVLANAIDTKNQTVKLLEKVNKGKKTNPKVRQRYRAIKQNIKAIRQRLGVIIDDLKFFDRRTIKGAQAKLLETHQDEIQFYRHEVNKAVSLSLSGIASSNLFTIDKTEEYSGAIYLNTNQQRRKYYKNSYKQDVYDLQSKVPGAAYEAVTPAAAVEQNAYKDFERVLIDPQTNQRYFIFGGPQTKKQQRQAKRQARKQQRQNKRNGGVAAPQKYVNQSPSEIYGYTVDKNGCRHRTKLKTDGTPSENTRENYRTGGLFKALPEAIIGFVKNTMGHQISKEQEMFLRITVLAGGIFAVYKAMQAAYKGFGKLIGSDKFHHILLGAVGIEAASTIAFGHGLFGPALASLIGGKDTQYVLNLTDNLGITTPIENEKDQSVQLATANQYLQSFSWGQLTPFMYTRKDGKLDLNYDAMIVKYPNDEVHLRSMKNSNNPDLFHNFVKRLNVNPEKIAEERPDELVNKTSLDVLKKDAKEILGELEKRGLVVAAPAEYKNLQNIYNSYDKDLSWEENILNWKNQKLISKETLTIENEDQIRTVGKFFQGFTVGEIQSVINNGNITLSALHNLYKSKGKGKVFDQFKKTNKGGPKMKKIIEEVLDTVGFQNISPTMQMDAMILSYLSKETRQFTMEQFMKNQGLEFASAHTNKKDLFLQDASLLTKEQMEKKLEEYLDLGYFTFNHQRVGYLENYDHTNNAFDTKLATPAFSVLNLNFKEKKILAALAQKLNESYSPPYSVDYAVKNGKLEIKFKGTDANNQRVDRDGKALGNCNASILLDTKNITIDGFVDETGAKLPFKNKDLADNGMTAAILFAFQFGITKHSLEGRAAIPSSPDGTEGPFEKKWFTQGMQFREASLYQEYMENLFKIRLWDIIPGSDIVETLFEYNKSLVATGLNDKKNSHIRPLSTNNSQQATYIEAMRRFYNKSAQWQSGAEKQESDIYNQKWKILKEQGVITAAWESAGDLKEDAIALYDNVAPEFVKEIFGSIGELIGEAYDTSGPLIKKLIRSIGAMAASGVEFGIDTVKKLTTAIKNGKLLDIAWEAGKLVLLFQGPRILYGVLSGTQGAWFANSPWLKKLAKVGVIGGTGAVIYYNRDTLVQFTGQGPEYFSRKFEELKQRGGEKYDEVFGPNKIAGYALPSGTKHVDMNHDLINDFTEPEKTSGKEIETYLSHNGETLPIKVTAKVVDGKLEIIKIKNQEVKDQNTYKLTINETDKAISIVDKTTAEVINQMNAYTVHGGIVNKIVDGKIKQVEQSNPDGGNTTFDAIWYQNGSGNIKIPIPVNKDSNGNITIKSQRVYDESEGTLYKITVDQNSKKIHIIESP